MTEACTPAASPNYGRDEQKILLRRVGPLHLGDHRAVACPRRACPGQVEVQCAAAPHGIKGEVFDCRCNGCDARAVIWAWAGTDGEWLRHPSWQEIVAELRDPTAASGWLVRLRQEFSPKWSLEAIDHLVQVDCAFRTHRVPLLEMGQVLATVHCYGIGKRLRNPNPKEYLGVRQELRGGAMLLEMGAHLVHEPTRPRSGPDWHATWPDGAAFVEVKLPRTSVQANLREVRACQLTSEFLGALGDDVRNGEGVWVTVLPTEAFLDNLGDRLEDLSRVKLRARHAARVFAMMHKMRSALRPPRVHFTLLEGCDVLVRPRRDGMTGLAVDGFFVVANEDENSLRLKDDLELASHQLKEVPGRRVILLDTSQDSASAVPSRRTTATVRSLIETELWATRLACVMVVYRDYPHTIVEFVLGRADDALETFRLLRSKLRQCERGHLHCEPLVPTMPCTLPASPSPLA